MSEEFVGVGWAFPSGVNRSGGVALVRGVRELEESMHIIVATAPGERPMRPDFGCAIHDYVFAPADATTAGRIAYEVRVALERWEPRVDIIDVIVSPDPKDASKLYIDVMWSIRDDYDPHNLVFPFYVIPSEEPEPESGSSPAVARSV